MARALQLALVTAGAILLVGLIRTVGISELEMQLRGFGPAFAAVVALELLLDGCHTLAWRRTLPVGAVGFWRLYWMRQAGTAVNQLTPTATLGGEVVKAALLRPWVGAADGVTSIVAAKLSFAIAQAAIVIVGLAAVLARLQGTPAFRAALLLGALATCAGVAGFLVLQRHGLLSRLTGALARIAPERALFARAHEHAALLDARLATFHHDRSGAFARSVGWHIVGQLVGVLQLVVILHALGTPAALATCLAIEALSLVIDSALFFVPGRVGVQEGGRVLVFTALGLSPATGLAVALIVRATQLAVAAIGVLAFAYFSFSSAPVTGSVSRS